MSIQKYKAFIKTVEYGSFTKAAQFLEYTQSGISHMVQDLEAEWGVALLERDRAGVRLTSDGVKLLPFIKRVCEANADLLTMVDELNGLKSGFIRIGTFSSVATHWLPNMIKTFQVEYPQIEFEILLGDYTEIERWISEGRVDFGFLCLPTKTPLHSVFLENDRLLAVLPPDHPLAACRALPLKALEEYPFMLLDKGGKSEIAAVLKEHRIQPDIRFTTWDDYAIMAMVENGLGISILPELILQRNPYHIVAKELEVPAYRRIGIVMKDEKTISLAARRFLHYLQYRHGQ